MGINGKNTNGQEPLVIVLSRNYSTGLGVIRSLGAAGYTVDLIASVKKRGSAVIASSSKYVRKSVEVLSTKIQGDDGEGIINALLSYVSEDRKKVIFPVDDFTAAVVAGNRERLSRDFLFPDMLGEDRVPLVKYMDKVIQAGIAEGHGLSVPRHWIVSIEGDIKLCDDIKYPCFVKPLQSISGQKTEMGRFDSADELLGHLENMKDYYSDRSVLVQEYLDIEAEYDLCGVCLDREVIIPALIEKTRVAGFEKGVTMSGKLVPLDDLGEAKGKTIDMLKSLRYFGMFDLEFIKSGGKLFFSEINFRSGGPNYSYFLNGANLPAIVVEELVNGSHDKEWETVNEYGKSFVYEKVAWEDHMRGYLSKEDFLDCINNSDYKLLENDDDPEPGRHFNKRIRMSAMKHRALQMAGKEHRAEKAQEGKDTAEPLEHDVLITGRNSGNLLAMARDMGKAGYTVRVLRLYKTKPKASQILVKMKPEAFSVFVKQYEECIADNDTEKVADKLLEMAGERTLLVPVDDYSAYAVDMHRDRLKEKYILPGVREEQGALADLMNKEKQKAFAKEAGLPVLKSMIITDAEHIPDDVPLPCFIKPAVSMKSVKTVMKKCGDLDELKGSLGGEEMIAEEYSDVSCEYALLGLSAAGKVIIPCLFRTLRGGNRARKGVAATGVTMSCDGMRELIEKCRRMVSGIGYTGLFDIDLIKDKQGNMYFLEINLRAGASMHVFAEKGINLAGIMADALLAGKPVPDVTEDAGGTTFASEKVLLEEYVSGDISRKEFDEEVEKADVLFICDEIDDMPFRHYRKYLRLAELAKKIRKNKG